MVSCLVVELQLGLDLVTGRLYSGYAHVFILRSVVIVILPSIADF